MPISPLARLCLFQAYQNEINVSKFEEEFENLVSFLNPCQKGFYIEWLLITLISLVKLKKVQIKNIKPNGTELVVNFYFIVLVAPLAKLVVTTTFSLLNFLYY